ncbi:hypothetical protein ACHAXR_010123 [Thalassiosira sp. AJA248-18]
MGRALRSGRQIASLSPPKNKRGAAAAGAAGKKKNDNEKPPSKTTKAAAAAAPKRQARSSARTKTAAPKKQPVKKAAPPAKPAKKSAPPPAKKGASKTTASASKKRQPKKEESSESEEEEDEEVVDQDNESEEEESSDEEDEVKKVALAASLKKFKSPAAKKNKKEESSEEDSSEEESDDEVKKVAPAPLKKSKQPVKTMKEESSQEESSDDEVDEVAPKPLKKAAASASKKKKDESSSSSEEEEDDEEDVEDDGSSNDSVDENNDKGFTDENANWLKPKQSKMKLMSSDEEEGDDDDDDDEFNVAASDEEDDEMLEVERQSRLIDAEMKLEQDEAESELRRTIADQTAIFHLPTLEEIEEDENRVVPPSELRARIEDVLEVLASFKSRREPGRSRSEYIERLGQDMAELFGYLQELVDYFLSMLGPNECLEFLEASEKSRPLVVRVNTLKARRKDLAAALMKRGVRLDPLAPWSKVGLKIYESTVPVGATPEYLAGHYMLQSAASMCPVMALGPQPGDRVLDMSAAPGGKTSYISQLMRNKGVVIANDLKPERQKATVANLHRLGVRNVITCCYDGRKIGVQMRNSFDRILLDAPCSGLGVISRDPSVKVQRTMPDVKRCAHLQKELLVAAVDALNHKSKKGGGYMVYSTCSVAVAENEEVVNYLLSKRDVKIVDAGLDFGKPGFTRFEHKRFHPSVALTRRFYPHVHNMDGFYVAKIQKLSDKRKGEEDKKEGEKATTEEVVKDDTVKVDAAGGNDKKNESSKKKKKKRKIIRASNDDANDNNDDHMARKKSKISYPDVQAQKNNQKKKTNAKVTKPRRFKITGM